MSDRINQDRGSTWLDPNQIHALYSQDKIWINKERETVRISEIDDYYLYNLNRFIEREGRRHCLGAFVRYRPIIEPRGDMARLIVETSEHRMYEDFSRWSKNISSSPLKKAIEAEMERRNLEDYFV